VRESVCVCVSVLCVCVGVCECVCEWKRAVVLYSKLIRQY